MNDELISMIITQFDYKLIARKDERCRSANPKCVSLVMTLSLGDFFL